MKNEMSLFKAILPNLVKNASEFFELDLTIKLFGVKVFQFHFPPKEDIQKDDMPC